MRRFVTVLIGIFISVTTVVLGLVIEPTMIVMGLVGLAGVLVFLLQARGGVRIWLIPAIIGFAGWGAGESKYAAVAIAYLLLTLLAHAVAKRDDMRIRADKFFQRELRRRS